MYKKIISTVLSAAILSACACPMVLAKEEAVLLNQTFDNQITNDLPAGLQFSGNLNSRVIQEGNKNKVFYLCAGFVNNIVTLPVTGLEKNFIISFEYNPGSTNVQTEFSLLDSSGAAFTPLKFNGQEILSHDGKSIAYLSSERNNKIDFGYSTSNNRYFVAVNGREQITQWISDSKISTPVSLQFKTQYSEDNAAHITLDNIRAYNGTQVRTQFPDEGYNVQEKEFTEIEYKEETGLGDVFLNNDFDDPDKGFAGISVEAKDNILEIRQDQETGNGYLYLDRNKGTDPLINVQFSQEVGQYLVLQGDFRIDKPGAANKQIFRMRDTGMAWSETFEIGANGEVTLHNKKTVSKMDIGKWYNYAVIYDFRRKTFDFYENHERIAADVPMSNQNFGEVGSMRITVVANSGAGDLLIDNLKIYECDTLNDLTDAGTGGEDDGITEFKSKFPSDDVDIQRLNGTIALSQYTDSIFIKDKKTVLGERPYVRDGWTLVPVRAISEGFGVNVDWDPKTQEIMVGNNVKMQIGSNVMTVDKEEIPLKAAPEIKNDMAFLPLRDLAETALHQKVAYDNASKLIVISSGEFAYANDEEVMRDLHNYLFYDRYNASELKKIYEEAGMANVHPRIIAKQSDFDRAAQLYTTDPVVKNWIDQLINQANTLLDQPPVDYYIPDGLRLLETCRTVLKRMYTLGFVYKITGDKRYSERVWKELEHVGKYIDWNPKHFLDVGEMTAANAIGYDWCYDAFTQEQRAYIENSIIKFGLNAGEQAYSGGAAGTDFTTARMNWNIVCNGGLTLGALAIADVNPDKAFTTVSLALRSLEYMMPEFAPSGAWEEGAGYWSYTMDYTTYLLSTLNAAMGQDFHLSQCQGMEQTGRFYLQSMLNTAVNNYHDASANIEIPASLFWLADRFHDPDLTDTALKIRQRTAGAGKMAGNSLDCLWYQPVEASQISGLPLDGYFAKSETSSMRASWDDAQAMAAGFHGGNATVNHGHIDSGTYVIDMLGKRWAIDFGPEDYNAGDYFGSSRNTYYRVRAEGHNVFVIDPDESAGQELDSFSPITRIESKPKGALQVMDLTDAYRTKANSAKRGYLMTDDRRTFIVQDEIDLKDESDIYSFMHTYADVQIKDNTTAILTIDGVKMQVKVYCSAPEYELSLMEAKPLPTSPSPEKQSSNDGARKLAVKTHTGGKVTIAMRFTPLLEHTAGTEFTVSSIDSWTLPEGTLSELPKADMIYVGGKAVTGFSPDTKSYSVMLPHENTSVPEITVDAAEARAEIEYGALDGTTTIKLYRTDSPFYNVYTMAFHVIEKQADVQGYGRYDPVEITASSVPEAVNAPINVADGNLETRWSGEGSQWIQLDLGEVKPVDAVAVAYMKGNERKYMLQIQVSEDGKTFETVYEGTSGGTSSDYEIFRMASVKKARYVRLCGDGSTENKWNSVTEFGALYSK